MRKWPVEEIEEWNACLAVCMKQVNTPVPRIQEQIVDVPVLHTMTEILEEIKDVFQPCFPERIVKPLAHGGDHEHSPGTLSERIWVAESRCAHDAHNERGARAESHGGADGRPACAAGRGGDPGGDRGHLPGAVATKEHEGNLEVVQIRPSDF